MNLKLTLIFVLTFLTPYSMIMVDTIYYVNPTSMTEIGPDLIISSIFSQTIVHKRNDSSGGTPQRSSPPFRSYEYTITIKNIGTDIVADAFYLAWARVGADITKEKYSRGVLVNKEKNIIPIDGSMEIKLTFGDNEGRKFLVNPKDIENYPFIPELNYDNNSYLY